MQRPVVVTAATVYPVTVQEVFEHSRIDDQNEATYINSLIIRATAYAERYLGRRLLNTELRANWDEFPDEILPPEPPYRSLKTLKYYNTSGTLTTLASTASSTAISVDSDSQPARIRPAYGTAWPATREMVNAVQLDYYAGYSTAASGVPQTIRHAILMLVAHLYENREPYSESSLVEVPAGVNALLDCEHYGRLYDGA